MSINSKYGEHAFILFYNIMDLVPRMLRVNIQHPFPWVFNLSVAQKLKKLTTVESA